MDKTIKTREVIKDIKTLERKPAVLNAAREIAIKGRVEASEQAAETFDGQQRRSPNAYAEEKTEQGAKDATLSAVRAARTMGEKAADKTSQELSMRAAQGTSTRQMGAHAEQARNATTSAKQGAIHTKEVTAKGIKQAGRSSVKGAGRTVKTAQTTSKVATKGAHSATQSAKATAKGTQIAARNTAQAARVTARATAQAARAAVKAVTAFVKMAIVAVKSLVAAIAAGGWVAVVVVIIICLVGLIATSAFGIFFTGGDMGDGNPTLRTVIQETNQEYSEKIEQLKNENTHDELILTGSQVSWTEVLAIFAVKTTTNAENALDVVTLDEQRRKLLKNIFWDMNQLDTRTEDRTYTEITSTTQANGSKVDKTETFTRRTLYIIQSFRSASEMAAQYGFTAKQQDLLNELLSRKYASTWQSVLYGMSSGAGDIVEIARSQIGNIGGQPYWSWYGFNGRVEWCACFVSWCANEVGYIERGQVPRFSYCPTGAQWFKDAGRWQSRGYVPSPGDIIFFDWEGDGVTDHVGIVESCDGATVATIEGNSSDACRRLNYRISSSVIYGYGTIS